MKMSEGVKLSARVGSQYFSYAKGYRETVEVYDPTCLEYVPKPRFGHCATLLGDKWYLFGGVSCPLSFVEVYDAAHQRWRQCNASGQVPEASFGLACSALEGKIYTFAGSVAGGVMYSNILSELDIDQMVWRCLQPCNSLNVPMLKKDAAMTSCGRRLVTFGGYGKLPTGAPYHGQVKKSEGCTNELIYYDMDQSMWLLPEVSGVSPRPCSGCSLTDIGGERRVLLGGLQKGDCCAGSMESVVILDMSASVWNWLRVTSPSGKPSPPPRYGHAAVDLRPLYSNSVLILWGRGDGVDFLDDAWVLRISDDIRHCYWNAVSFPKQFCKPAFRSTVDLIVNSEVRQLVRFGGFVNDKISAYDDMYMLDIACGDGGSIEVLTCRNPVPKSGRDRPCTRDSGCVADDDHADLKFLGLSQEKELAASSEGSEVDMSDIGLKLSIPPGAIPGDQSLPFSVRPAAGGNIDMPANCVPHSPLYLIPSLLMQERVKITIEHSCSIQSEEDRDRMVFLGVDTSQQQVGGGYKLKEVEDVEVEFEIGDQKGCIYLKEVQSLRIGRRTDSSPGKFSKTLYSALWFADPSPPTPESTAIFTVTQLQAAYIECVKREVMKEYPRVKKTVYQPVSFTSDDEVRLEASPVEGWDLNSNKLDIDRESVDLPDKIDVTGLDYPPLATIRATRRSQHPLGKTVWSTCSVKVTGLNKNLMLEMILNGTLRSSPLQIRSSPPPLSTFSDRSSSVGYELMSPECVMSPTSPKCYTPETILDIDDLALLHSVLKEAMNHWEFIGINLMPHSEVEAIRINPTYAVYGSERYFLEMLVKFLQSPEKKCIRHLQLALEEADFQHLAANFLQQLNSRTCDGLVADESAIQSVPHGFAGFNTENMTVFEQPYKRAKFENDIKEAAKELLDCIGRWEGNELLNIAKEVALQIQEIQILLGNSEGILSAIMRIKEKCQKLTKLESLTQLVDSQSVTGQQLNKSIGGVDTLSYQLAHVASLKYQLRERVTEDMLLQNIQNLSSAIQSLLETSETASLERYGNDSPLVWRQPRRPPRATSIANRTKELENKGFTPDQLKYGGRSKSSSGTL